MKRNKIEEVDVNAKERRQFKCDRCGMLCTYDNLCYKCNQNLEDEMFSVKLKQIKRLKNIIKKQNREIEQLKTEAYVSLGGYKKFYNELYFNAINRNKDLYTKLKKQEDEIKELKQGRDAWKKACELACMEVPTNHCPNPPEYYDASYEYGSDGPYYIEEGGCELTDHCLECCLNYFYEKAQKDLEILEKF